MIARRSIIKGLAALVAAPAIIKVADLMPINAGLVPGGLERWQRELMAYKYNIDRRSIDVLYGMRSIDVLYGSKLLRAGDVVTFGSSGIDPTRQFVVTATEQGHFHADYIADRDFYDPAQWNRKQVELITAKNSDEWLPPAAPDKLTIAAAAVAVAPLVLAKPVTRRFWAR